MRTYFAVSTKKVKMGGLVECLKWAETLIRDKKAKIVKIHEARPNEPLARIVFEVDKKGVRATPNGRTVNLSLLKKVPGR